MNTKICSCCKKSLPIESFYKRYDRLGQYLSCCKNCKNENTKKFNSKHPEKQKSYWKHYYNHNKTKILNKNTLYNQSNKDKVREYFRLWQKNEKEKNPSYRIRICLSVRILKALKGLSKSKSTLKLLGCDIPTLRTYLSSKFQPGMTWENHGLKGWHIDHIKPCDAFDLTDPIQQKICFHYTNLQPLWAKDNLKKGCKYG